MIMTQERMILKGQAQLDEMVTFVRKADNDGRPIDQAERGLWQSLLVGYVAGVGPGDVGETLTYEGLELRRLELPHDGFLVVRAGHILSGHLHSYGAS